VANTPGVNECHTLKESTQNLYQIVVD
jgi:hypothetical protein